MNKPLRKYHGPPETVITQPLWLGLVGGRSNISVMLHKVAEGEEGTFLQFPSSSRQGSSLEITCNLSHSFETFVMYLLETNKKIEKNFIDIWSALFWPPLWPYDHDDSNTESLRLSFCQNFISSSSGYQHASFVSCAMNIQKGVLVVLPLCFCCRTFCLSASSETELIQNESAIFENWRDEKSFAQDALAELNRNKPAADHGV